LNYVLNVLIKHIITEASQTYHYRSFTNISLQKLHKHIITEASQTFSNLNYQVHVCQTFRMIIWQPYFTSSFDFR